MADSDRGTDSKPTTPPAVRYERDGEVGRIVFDQPGRPLNVLSTATLEDLAAALDRAARDTPQMLLLVSGKPGTFIAGADVFELASLSREVLDMYLERGQDLFNCIAGLPLPTAAVIGGAALGGGMEIALACDYRVTHPKAKLGLPEVTLGLIPAWGGCARLPRLIGAAPAAKLIANGQILSAEEAKRAGIVDDVADDPESAARSLLAQGKARREEVVPDLENLRRTVSEVRQELFVAAAPHADHYPAPLRALEAIHAGLTEGIAAGLSAERAALLDLRETRTGANLLRNFALKRNAHKQATRQAGGQPADVRRIGVVGGGTMGTGIAYVMLRAGLSVTLVETDADRAADAAVRVAGLFEGDVAKGRMQSQQVEEAKGRLAATAELEQLAEADLIVEAAFEDLDVKRGLFARLDSIARPQVVLASNTSSLGVAALAEATRHPGRVVGVHFFNPVPKMALVEVVRTPESKAAAVATAVAAAVACGKTPVVVSDAPGFIVNRLLFPYLCEAMRLVADRAEVEAIDDSARQWGLPMGPLELIDTIGLDVTLRTCEALHPRLGDRVDVPLGLREAVSKGHLGRKGGDGFYCYDGGKRSAGTGPAAELFAEPGGAPGGLGMPERLVLPMVNEAARVLEEGVVESVDAIDLATLLGLGLAPFRGGIARYIDDEGPDEIVRELEMLSERYGERFEPSPLLQRAADEGRPLASYGRGGGS